MRKRIYEIVEIAKQGDIVSNIYDIFMMACIIASLIPLCTKSTAKWTVIVDLVTVIIFIVDYLLRWMTADYKYAEHKGWSFLRYPFSCMALIDLLSILPSFGFLGNGLKIFKVFRLLKTFRALRALRAMKAVKAMKLVRYSKSVDVILQVIREQKEALITVGGFAVGYILIAALIVFNVEPNSFDTFFEAIYWACVSLTTVGYGDIYPVSTAGRIVTMISSIVGIAIVALPAGIITAGYMEVLQKNCTSEGKENPEVNSTITETDTDLAEGINEGLT